MPHAMAERRQHSKTPHGRGFLLHRELSVINYNVLNAPNNPVACAPSLLAVRKRELVLRHIADKAAAARVETQTRRGRLLQRAGERAAGSRESAAALKQKQQQQRSHAAVSSRTPSHDEMKDFSSFLGNAIDISEEDEATFHAELAQFD